MPFKSKAQMRAAFGGYLGPEMKSKAKQWADETPNIKKLPMKKSTKKSAKSKYESSALDKSIDKKMKLKEGSKKDEAMDAKMMHHSGKGTRARLTTAANKMFFGKK